MFSPESDILISSDYGSLSFLSCIINFKEYVICAPHILNRQSF